MTYSPVFDTPTSIISMYSSCGLMVTSLYPHRLICSWTFRLVVKLKRSQVMRTSGGYRSWTALSVKNTFSVAVAGVSVKNYQMQQKQKEFV